MNANEKYEGKVHVVLSVEMQKEKFGLRVSNMLKWCIFRS